MIFDLHNDLPTSDMSVRDRRLKALSVTDSVIYAFWTTELQRPVEYIKKGLDDFGGSAGMFAVEDLGFLTDGDINALCEYKPLYCGLTHNSDNHLAGGAMGDGCLTEFGKEVIRRLNKADIAVDAAHLNRKSFYKVADVAERLINSHTGLDWMCGHCRNLTDGQIKIILSRGGIIGLTAVRDFIGGNDTVSYVQTIDGFVQRYGLDGASIGTDFYGTEPINGLRDYKDFASVRYMLENLGYTEQDIRKIFFENADNYFSYRRSSIK